ncbi:MAG: type II toxin-antitoxin system Phd/YefM family antitoxin [Actinobacteria bacterium]|nr:type II toxin-antitoxin system Phd/YefM family antitoxin [Actinomycetota bacterium]
MREREVAAGKFKAECLGLLDDVAATGRPLVVTKRGKPVARVVPVEAPPSLRGSVTYLVDDEELLASLGEPWEAETT